MKKKLPSITIIITVVLVIAGYFAYREILKPMLDNNTDQTETIAISTENWIEFGKLPDQNLIYSLELEFSGLVTQDIEVSIGNNKAVNLHSIKLKKGTVDYVYLSDWYSDSCFVRINAERNTTDSLAVICRFLGD